MLGEGRSYSSARTRPDTPSTWRSTTSSLVSKAYSLRSLVTSAPDPRICHRWYNIWTGFWARPSDSATDLAVNPSSNNSTADTASDGFNVLPEYMDLLLRNWALRNGVQLSGTTPLLRQYFPKSTNLAVHSPRDLARVESELNRRPRITLGDRTPAELFAALLASENHPPLR